MFPHPVWAVGSYSSGPQAARTVGTQSTGGLTDLICHPVHTVGQFGKLSFRHSSLCVAPGKEVLRDGPEGEHMAGAVEGVRDEKVVGADTPQK